MFSIGINRIQKSFYDTKENNISNLEISEKNRIENFEIISENKIKNFENIKEKTELKEENNENKSNVNFENNNLNINEELKYDWYIEIPKIDLYAPIEDGTTEEILDRSVGHFETTSRRNGNCGLAGHNRGYKVNYFENLKFLEQGDIINYFVDERKYQYKITESVIIYETDWSYLEDTEESKITLITCVEDRPEYRLCVQGNLVEE